MIVNQNIRAIGCEVKKTSQPTVPFLFSPTFSYKFPTRFGSWKEIPKCTCAIEKWYDFPSIMSSDCSVWDDEKQEYVQLGEGVVIKVGNRFVWFEPCELDGDDTFFEVNGEFELVFDYFCNLKLKVKA